MNRSFLTVLGRMIFASASLVIFQTAANAQESQLSAIGSKLEGKINQEQQIIDNPGENEQILAQRSTRRRERRENNGVVPEAVKSAAIENLSQQTGIEASEFKVEEAKQVTWTDGCLGLGSPGLPCSEGRVPGWEVVVASKSQRWVYRSNMSGSLVKLDALATQAIASRPSPSQTSEETASGTEEQTTTSSRRTPARQSSRQSRTSGETASRTEEQTTTTNRRTARQPSRTAQESASRTEEQTTTTRRTARQPSRTAQESASRTEEQTTTTNRRQTEQPSQTRTAQESASRSERQTTTSSRRAAGQASSQSRSSGETASRTEEQATSSRRPTDQVSRETRASQTEAQATSSRRPTDRVSRETRASQTEAQATSSRRPTDRVSGETRASQETASQTEAQTTTTPRRLAQQPSNQTMMEGKGEFSLAVWQPSANLSEVVTRLSVKSRQGDSFSSERYIGDYRYRVNQRAKFMGGINPGDRVVVRLYNFQNQLLGYSEFEVLPQNMAVNVILGNRPLVTRVVRTVYGIDADRNVTIDRGAEIFDYYTQITGTAPSQERVTFMGDSQGIDKTWFQVAGLPVPPQSSVYPDSYASASSQTIDVYGSDLPAAITATPGDSVVNVQTGNSYNLAQQPSPTQQATRSTQQTSPTQQATRSTQEATPSEVQASFADVPSDFWAKNFISQLAVKGVLQGYPDGLYRPKDTVTRAEFATILSGAFRTDKRREVVAFKDVPTNHWAYPAIRDAYERGFLDTDSSRNFNPDEKITRLDVLVALAKGLNYSTSASADKVLRVYRDAGTIPRSDRTLVAAVTERNIVVNYPNVRSLNPRREANRAEVAALIYRALVSTGEVADIPSPYVVEESTAQEEVREQPRPTQRRQTAPTRRINNNNGTRQNQPVRRSNSTNSNDTNRVRRTNTVQRSNTNNSTRRTTSVQRSNTNNSVRRANTVPRSNTNNSVRSSSTTRRES